MTYEIINGWIVGKLPGPGGGLIPGKHFPQGPYERRQRNNPLLCLHTTETHGYVEDLRFPSEFQVGEDVIGQHRPLWARGSAVDEHDHDLFQIEIVGFSKLDPWLPKPESLSPARRADGAPGSPRIHRNCAETSRSVAGPARSTSGGCGHVLPAPRGLGRRVRVRSRRDPGRRALGPGFARLSDVVLDGPRRSGREGGRWRDAFRQSDRGDPVRERDAPIPG